MATPKFCPSCGAAVPPGSRHCGSCGADLQGATQYNEPSYQTPPTMHKSGMNNFSPVPQPPRRNNPLLITVIVLGGIVVVAIVAFLIWFAMGKASDSEKKVIHDTVVAVAPVPAAEAPEAKPAPVEEVKEPSRPRRSSPYDYVVDGSVGKYGIQMEISFEASGNITGRYRYNRMKGAGGWLMLHGYHTGSSFEMYETDSSGNVTGTFSGRYSTSGDAITISGSMMNSKGTTYSFNVKGYESN